MLLGRSLFWNDKCDRPFVEGLMVRVNQFNKHFVRTGEKTHQDDWVTTRIGQNSVRRGVEAKSEQGTNADKFALGLQILSIRRTPSSAVGWVREEPLQALGERVEEAINVLIAYGWFGRN
jgi:hypothetical protein